MVSLRFKVSRSALKLKIGQVISEIWSLQFGSLFGELGIFWATWIQFSVVSHPLTHSLTHHPLTHSLTHSPNHPFIHSLTHQPTHSLTHLLTHPPTHTHTHPPTHSLTHPLTHSPTLPLTHPLIHPPMMIVVVPGRILIHEEVVPVALVSKQASLKGGYGLYITLMNTIFYLSSQSTVKYQIYISRPPNV